MWIENLGRQALERHGNGDLLAAAEQVGKQAFGEVAMMQPIPTIETLLATEPDKAPLPP